MELDFTAAPPCEGAIVFPDFAFEAPERQPPIGEINYVVGSTAGSATSVTGSTTDPAITGI